MDDRKELKDILIGGEEDRARQSKKIILLIVGIVVLILACVIIAISMTSSKNDDTIVVGGSENVNPALPATDSFNSVPVDTEEDKFEQIVQEIKKKQQNVDAQNTQPTIPSTPIVPAQEQKVTMPDRKETTPPKVTVTSSQKPRGQQSNVYRGNNGDIAENGYYLQVGAFSKTPNKDFLDRINRYSYRIQEIMINSKVITRYLVGPYSSREAAQMDYDNIVRDIATPVYLQVD